jgi:hypothetical protein
MAIKYTEKKFNAARNLIFVEANIRRWRQQKQRLKNHGPFQDLEEEIVELKNCSVNYM